MTPTKFTNNDGFPVEFITDTYQDNYIFLMWAAPQRRSIEELSMGTRYPSNNEIIQMSYDYWLPKEGHKKLPKDQYRVVLSAPDGRWIQDSAGEVAPKTPSAGSQPTRKPRA